MLSTSLVEAFHHFKRIIRVNYEISPWLVRENHEDDESGSIGSIFLHSSVADRERSSDPKMAQLVSTGFHHSRDIRKVHLSVK